MLDAADNFSLKVTNALNKLHEAVELVPEEDLRTRMDRQIRHRATLS